MQQNSEVTVKAYENGPYVIQGPLKLMDADGQEYDVSAKKSVALCRCGASTNKPFCDGAHSRVGFEAAERAVREGEGEGKDQL